MTIVTFGLCCLTLFAVVKGDDNNVLRIDGSSVVDGNEGGWDEDSWYVQVDGVMGGQSTGRMEFITTSSDENNKNEFGKLLKFTGDISLDGGGFSSVRRQISLNLNDYDGIVVTFEADNYDISGSSSKSTPTPPTGIHLQFGDSTSYYDFSSAFAIPLSTSTSSSELTSVYLPMDSFNRGTRFGFACRDNCELDNTNIDNLSVFVLFQEGTFDVRIKSISAIPKKWSSQAQGDESDLISSGAQGPRSFLSPQIQFDSVDEIINLLQSTISSGGSLYDKSYIELCITMYWSVLNSILNANANANANAIAISTKVVICSGLNEMIYNKSNNSKEDQAWILRYTIDAIIADLQGLDRSTNNNFLPTKKEAELMDATCVGRTSPPEGTLYDSNGNMIDVDSEEDLLLQDEDIMLDEDTDGGGNNSSSTTSSTILSEDGDDDDDPTEELDVAAIQKAVSLSSGSGVITPSWTVLIVSVVAVGLATTTTTIIL
jgi:hypothetical protein